MFDMRNVLFLSNSLMHIITIIAFVSAQMLLNFLRAWTLNHDENAPLTGE
jgi:hypothetical protein